LGRSYEVNGNSARSHEEGQRQCVVRKQEYPFNRPLKKLDQKRYRLFKISKDIGLEMFQLELPERWMIHNMFNEDLLTKCRKPHFKGQYMEPAPPPIIINKEEKYKVEEVRKH